MKKNMLFSCVLMLVLSACSKSYNADEAAQQAGTQGSAYPYGSEFGGDGNFYGSDMGSNANGGGNFFGFGDQAGANPYGTGAAYDGNTYGGNAYGGNTYGGGSYGGGSNASVGDFYEDRSYGVNVVGGPSSGAKDRVIYFSYDSSSIDKRSEAVVREHARYLAANPNVRVTLEGHTDERGTQEYNVALGDRRAYSVKALMTRLGVRSNQIYPLSYGEERPAAMGSDERSYAKNRRVVIVY
ncbi:MAG: peptidoglycan-associated lipoprotein Pal [Cardiobacteriaceae bacterium]|nr:peptidoglycan-associated lipoprotein Pal [Cardiobacteriaceae bacterium]